MKSMPFLSLEHIEAGYGEVRALFDFSIDIHEGTVLAILGPNGAGKSTVAHVVSGLLAPTRGEITLDGHRLTGQPGHRFRRHGICYVPEGRGVFRSLSVRDNLRMAGYLVRSKEEREALLSSAAEMFSVLGVRANQVAGTLSGGEQQMLAVAMALAGGRSRLVIVDEVSLGLAPKVVDLVFETLKSAKDQRVTMLLIEQFVDRALDLADEAIVMRNGTIVWHGTALEVSQFDVLEQYLGKAE
jgi:branched-chain amino acid transport system ATP-binding protein